MFQRSRRRKPRWLRLLGIDRDAVARWRGVGLSSMALFCAAVALVNHTYFSTSQLSEAHKYSTDQNPSTRKLLSSGGGGNSSGPAWESCDYENSTIPGLWVVVHTVLILILFIALAVICDDFFVPSLEAISEKLHLSEDVAGATFMAAGSSAPELFTSIVGVAVETDVGVGTIVGSAIFNLLIIIAMTAALAGQVLILDWRPLLRDSLCYAASVACFIGFTWDGWLVHYEAALFILLYVFYIILMYFNPQIMAWMGTWKCCGSVKPADEPKPVENGDANQNEKIEADANPDPDSKGEDTDEQDGMQLCPCLPCCPVVKTSPPSSEKARTKGGCWTWFKLILSWIFFILAFPFVCLFSWTIPDCSKPKTRKWFMVSFLMCVLWLAVLTFTMVTLVSRAGCIIGIDSYVMGLVVIAIGTSVPDCLSSVLVAREGYGDMAISNAIGSNVFDIDLGLGLPFILRIAVDAGKPMNLLSDKEWGDYYNGSMPILTHTKFGLILLLFLLICLLVFGIVRFRLNAVVGVTFVILYILFLTYAFIQELYCVQKLGIYC